MRMAETRALQNERALARLTKALPDVFPAPVLNHALNRRWTRRCHDLRSTDTGARIRCARTG